MSRIETLRNEANKAAISGRDTELHLGRDGSKAGSYTVEIRNDVLSDLLELIEIQHMTLQDVATNRTGVGHVFEAIDAYENFDEGRL